MEIRTATMSDLEAITEVEAVCFPPAEAADGAAFRKRLEAFPKHFWLLEDAGCLIGFINGMTTDKTWLSDDMYEDAGLHNENGKWQMIFGLDVLPEYRRRGCGELLMKHVIKETKRQGRCGIVLTCKNELIPYYEKFGFINEGISASVHGGVAWNDMRLTL